MPLANYERRIGMVFLASEDEVTAKVS